ncbi:MAG: hypothetical protein JSR82_18935 [Verrucomicrobia bacterium]|nr:hypothetical protein [Verrucomicrobiota bacterium]
MERSILSPFGRDTGDRNEGRRDRFDRRQPAPGSGNLFLWSVFLLLLLGAAMASWIGTFSVFGHPERPYAYRILRKIKKLDPPQRFKTNAAPPGKFQGAEELHTRFAGLSDFELRQANVQLTRDYLRNYQQTTAAVPYLMGRFHVVGAIPLDKSDLFPLGAAVLAISADYPQLLIELILPTDAPTAVRLAESVLPGYGLELRRTYDLSAVVHVARLPDHRLQATIVPLAYRNMMLRRSGVAFGVYTPGELTQPGETKPVELQLEREWPVVKEEKREAAEAVFVKWRQQNGLGLLLPRMKDGPAPAPEAKEPADVLAATDARAPRAKPAAAPKASASPTPKPAPKK